MSGTRRTFLQQVTGAALTAAATRTVLAEAPSCANTSEPARRVGLATIGIGGQGTGDTEAALKVPGVELVAVADVYDGRLTRARENFCDTLVTTRDYRELLARKDIDAVIVATPDHWHMRVAIDALEAGKDVYVEKPMVHSIEEGQKLIDAQKRTGRICQVGSQRVSSIVYKKAQELIAAGAIGKLNLVEAWWVRNSPIGAWQYTIPADASPATVDWERFLGDAPKRPFDATRLFRWRNYSDYGTGVAGDLFVHLFSGLHFVTGAIGPTRVMATGGLRHWTDGRDAADVMLGLFEYPKTAQHPEFTLSLKVDFADGAGESEGFRFVGPDGVLSIGWDGITLAKQSPDGAPGYTIKTFPQAAQDAFLKDYKAKYPDAKKGMRLVKEERFEKPQGYSDLDDHLRNFVEAVRTRTPVVEDPTFGFRAAGPALLCNLSQQQRRPIDWNPETLKVV
jgi:predicted dehydrogenase